jgi:hypothetical protein
MCNAQLPPEVPPAEMRSNPLEYSAGRNGCDVPTPVYTLRQSRPPVCIGVTTGPPQTRRGAADYIAEERTEARGLQGREGVDEFIYSERGFLVDSAVRDNRSLTATAIPFRVSDPGKSNGRNWLTSVDRSTGC